MKTIPAIWKQEKNKVSSTYPWVWLYEVNVPTTPTPSVLYYAEYTEEVVFNGNTYTPFPIQHSEVTESSEGRLDAIDVVVSNVTREIQAYLEQWDYLTNQKVTIHVVNMVDLSQSLKSDLYISSTQYNEQAITFTLSVPFDILGIQIPGRRFYRDKCGWVYKSFECGYVGTIETCDKTLGQVNGCRAHSNAVRFGCFPGIPQGQVIVQ